MADLTALREGIRDNFATSNPNVEAYAYVKDDISPPCFVVGVPSIVEYDTTIARGSDRWLIPCRMYVGRVDDQDAQATLDAYIDSKSATGVKTSVEQDRSLGGAASSVRVMAVENYGEYQIGNTLYLGAEFIVEVITQ